MAEHSKKITLSDIAQKLGISKSAVSFALKNSPMVSKETCKRVQGVAQKMGYKRNELFSSMMSSMRKGSRASFTENIAVINGNLESSALTTHPTLPRYYEGIRQEAERLGYGINEFWLHEKGLNAEKLTKIFNQGVSDRIEDRNNREQGIKNGTTSNKGGKNKQGHAVGLPYVPRDGYEAILHKGERVLTAQQNRQYNQGGSNISIPKLADTIVVREDADIDKIASALVKKIKTNTISYGGVF